MTSSITTLHVEPSRGRGVTTDLTHGWRVSAPRLKRNAVVRQRLLSRLAQNRDRRVVLISAPAGFGKTIVAAQLSERDPRPSGWIHLDKADNDPGVLLRDIVGMLEQLGAVAPGLHRELRSPAARIGEAIFPLLEEDMARRDPFLLVLDELDALEEPGALGVITLLLGLLPAGSQLVLTTRREPELPLARLRAAGDVLDVEWDDLRLDLQETIELLEASGLRPTDEQAEMLCRRAEGWAAGIALAVVSWGRRTVTDRRVKVAVGRSSMVERYLLEQAVQSQPPDVQRFLLASSLLRRMSPELCDAALAIGDSARVLASLEEASLFVVPLGEGWYRYHRLFRELLQALLEQRSPEVVPQVLGRAAAWHELHGDPGEAFEYFHACGDLTGAGRVVLDRGEELARSGQLETVRLWLRSCSAEELASDAQLAMGAAWIALLRGEAAEAQRLEAAATAALGDRGAAVSARDVESLQPALASLRAMLAPGGISQMRSEGEFVRAAAATEGTLWQLLGWQAVGLAQLLDGRTVEAIAAFSEVLQLTRGHAERDLLTINCLGYSALAAIDAGDWRRARKWARDAYALTRDSGLENALQGAAPCTARATVLQHDGLFREAGEVLEEALRVAPLLRAMRWSEADISLRLADVSLALGDLTRALDLADVARAALAHYPDAGLLPNRLGALDRRLHSGRDLGLTPSELRLVPFLPTHLSLQEIAAKIYLSRATVKTHTVSIRNKLGVSTRSAAVERLEELGFFQQSTVPVERA